MAKAFYDMGYTKTVAVNTARSDLNGLDLPDNQKFLVDEHADPRSRQRPSQSPSGY